MLGTFLYGPNFLKFLFAPLESAWKVSKNLSAVLSILEVADLSVYVIHYKLGHVEVNDRSLAFCVGMHG